MKKENFLIIAKTFGEVAFVLVALYDVYLLAGYN